MHSRDYRDIIGGALLIILGLWAGFHAMSTFDLGTPSRMGPGMFPASLGFLLAGLGALIALPALFRSGPRITVDWRPMIFIMLGVWAFAIIVVPFGMVPAIVVLTIAAVLADTKIGIIGTAILAVALSVLAYLIFRVGLGIVLEPFRWPF
jgi:hypothetical protein